MNFQSFQNLYLTIENAINDPNYELQLYKLNAEKIQA